VESVKLDDVPGDVLRRGDRGLVRRARRGRLRDTAHFTELLTQRVPQVDGVVAAESFLVLEIHKMAYGWGVGHVATTIDEGPK
jgi:hypothetical protein